MKGIALLAVLVATFSYVESQFITFKDGRLGVNFGGYHAGVGLGGALGGGTAGGLFAEAGTPQGQAARAGLGGVVDGSGKTKGGLYAGATAGGDVKASAGLAGGVGGDETAGAGYAAAQAGDHAAASGLGGHTSGGLSSGFSFGASKSYGGTVGVIKETEVQPVQVIETVHKVPVPKKVHHEFNFEAVNEVKPVVKTESVNIEYQPEIPPPTVVKEVYVSRPVVEKTVVRTYKPRNKASAYIGGYVGGGVAPPATIVQETVAAPAVYKRIDVNADSAAGAGAYVEGAGVGQGGYTKTVSVQRNPQFFSDIFNIPIQTLRAVGNFLGNAAGSTSVSVQKTASVQAESDAASSESSPKHASSESSAHISIDTSPVSKIIDDILAIPINTLGAVNKFLENNVPARKRIQVSADGEPARVRLGPHARRRANRVIVVEDETSVKRLLGNTEETAKIEEH